MPVRIAMETRGIDPAGHLRAFHAQSVAAVEAAMAGVREGLLTDLRQEIGAAFPRSRRLPTTITATAYPAREDGREPTVWVHPRKGSNIAAVLGAQRGATIRSAAGTLLAIPLPGVPRSGNDGRRRQMEPREYEAKFGRLVFVAAKPGAKAVGYLVAKGGVRRRGQRTPDRFRVLYVLVREVTLPPRLRPDETVQRWVGLVPRLIADAEARIRGRGR